MARGSRHSPSNGASRLGDTLTSSAASRSMSQSPTKTVPGTFAAARSDTSGPIPQGQPTETMSKSGFAAVAERAIAGSDYQTQYSRANLATPPSAPPQPRSQRKLPK